MRTAALLLTLTLAPYVHASVLDEVQRTFLGRLERAEPRLSAAWADFSLCRRPTMVFFEGRGTLLLGHPRPPSGFQRLPSSATSACPGPTYRPAGKAPLEAAFISKLPFAGADVFAYRVAPGAPFREQFETFAHEAFHLYQTERFAPRRPLEAPSQDSPEAAALRIVEGIQLALAFAPGEDWTERVRDFIAVRSVRYAALAPSEVAWESAQERWEGVAEYVGLSAALHDVPTPVEAASEVGARLAAALLRPATPDGATPRSAEPYAMGAAITALLERSGTPWRARIAAGEAPFEILRTAVTVKDPRTRVKTAKAASGYEELLALTALRLEEPPPDVPALFNAFRAAPGTRLVLSLWDTDSNSGFSSTGAQTHRIGGETLHPSIKTAEFARRGGLRVVYRETAILSRTGDAAQARRLGRADVLPQEYESLLGEDPGLTIELDERRIGLTPGSHPFKRLKLSGRKAVIESSRPGELRLSSGRVHILFDSLPRQ